MTKEETLPKKTCAIEVYKEVKTSKMAGIGMIIAPLIVAIAGNLHVWGGAITSGIFAVLGAFIVKKAMAKMQYFEKNYEINPKAI